MEKDLKLVSGSDLRGVAVDVGSGVTLGPDQARSAAYAFAEFLKKRTGQSSPLVALGRDPRLTGEALLHAAAEGLCAAGARAVDFGLCATPAMFEAVLALPSDGAIMITASHLPFERNGMKFVTKDGGLEHEEVADLARAMQSVAPCAVGDLPKVDFLAQYAARLADFVRARAGRGDKPLAGRKIAVDAGNGSGGFFAKLVLEPLGADTAGSQFLEPDGRFPNHIPNPEDGAAMEAACRMVDRIYQVDVPEKADVIVASCGGFPKDISLYQGTKTIDNIESGLKPGGTLILIIEAREGGGPAEYFDWAKDLVAGTIERRLREHFTVAGYIFFLNCEQAQRYNILLYSSIAPEDVAPMGIKAFSDVNALLDAAQLEGKSIYVIPNGSTVIPHVKEASKHEA